MCVRLGADERFAKLELAAGVKALLLQKISEIKGVARSDMDKRGAEILHEKQLAFGSSRPGWDHQAADFFRAVVHHEAAREEPVAHHVLKDILTGDAGHAECAGDEAGGRVEVAPGKEKGLGPAGGAAGSVEANGFVTRNGQEAVGVVLPEVGGGGEGEPAQVVERLEFGRGEARLAKAIAVQRHPIQFVDRFPEPSELQFSQRGTRQRFDVRIPKHWISRNHPT